MTPVELCNLALSLVGQPYIAQLEDESRVARVCATHWPQVFRRVLSASPWNSALRRATLAKLTEAPVYGWLYAYALPADCLRVHEVKSNPPFEVENRTLLTDADGVTVTYIAAVGDLERLHPAVVDALAAALAADIAYPLTHDKVLQGGLVKMAAEKLQWAVDEDGTEQQNATIAYGVTDYVTSRL